MYISIVGKGPSLNSTERALSVQNGLTGFNHHLYFAQDLQSLNQAHLPWSWGSRVETVRRDVQGTIGYLKCDSCSSYVEPASSQTKFVQALICCLSL